MPSANRFRPPNESISIIVDAYPGTSIPNNCVRTRMKIEYIKAVKAMALPKYVQILSGVVDDENIPSSDSFQSFQYDHALWPAAR